MLRKLIRIVRDWFAARPWVASVVVIVLAALLLVFQCQSEAEGLGIAPRSTPRATPTRSPPLDEKVFLPLVPGGNMSYWKLIVPESTINLVLNPSGEGDTEFSAHGGGVTVTAVSTDAKYGYRSYRVQTTNDHDGINLTTVQMVNAIHYVTFALRTTDTIPTNGIEVSADNTNWHQSLSQ